MHVKLYEDHMKKAAIELCDKKSYSYLQLKNGSK